MARATWNNEIIAESDDVIEIEGNLYFPPDSLRREFYQPNTKQTTCPWKGVASYYDVTVNGETNQAAAWYYAKPKSAASQIRDYVAFWRGVETAR